MSLFGGRSNGSFSLNNLSEPKLSTCHVPSLADVPVPLQCLQGGPRGTASQRAQAGGCGRGSGLDVGTLVIGSPYLFAVRMATGSFHAFTDLTQTAVGKVRHKGSHRDKWCAVAVDRKCRQIAQPDRASGKHQRAKQREWDSCVADAGLALPSQSVESEWRRHSDL